MDMSPSLSQLLMVGAALALAGCNRAEAVAGAAAINQAALCRVNDWQLDASSAVCKPGQKIVFLPETFGNEQLPIMFAAVNCDMRHSIALTKGGVACIYAPIKPLPPSEPPATGGKP
jgi:hypothetical protein